MNFPDTDKFIQLNEESKLSLLNVMMISGEKEEVDQNLLSWTIVEVTSKKTQIWTRMHPKKARRLGGKFAWSGEAGF